MSSPDGGDGDGRSYFELNKNCCQLCDVHFTSPQHRNDHYSGRKHKTAEMMKGSKEYPLTCDICLVPFTGQPSAQQHFNSAKHKKKADRYSDRDYKERNAFGESLNILDSSEISPFSPSNVYQRSSGNLQDLTGINIKISENKNVFENPLSKLKLKDSNDDSKERHTPDISPNSLNNDIVKRRFGQEKQSSVCSDLSSKYDESPVLSKLDIKPSEDRTVYCHLCDVKFTSVSKRLEHYSGKKHRNAEIMKESEEHPLKCDICLVSFTGPSSAQQHFSSAKHRNKAELHSGCDSNEEYSQNHFGKSLNILELDSNSNPDSTSGDCRRSSPGNLQYLPETSDFKERNIDISKNKISEKNSIPKMNLKDTNNDNKQKNTDVKKTQSTSLDHLNNPNTKSTSCIEKKTVLLSPKSSTDDGNSELPKLEMSNIPCNSPSLESSERKSPTNEEEYRIPAHQKGFITNWEVKGKVVGYYCDPCDKSFNSLTVLKSHIEGTNHCQKVSNLPSLERILPPINRECDDPSEDAYFLTEFIPRSYQIELFEKTCTSSNIIFLPTGTGKTLCAAMVICHMLKCNPERSVLFLVDKVLLALQQKKFLEEQLSNQRFRRFDTENIENTVERPMEVACVCGGSIGNVNRPLHMYDVIVTTAEYCFLRMKEKVLKWSDFSLVVIDEAHHCDKNHPFNKILKTQHRILQESERPQILGLTASPAGRETHNNTVSMLRNLLQNLGNTKIAIVEDDKDELTKYKSSAKLKIETLLPNKEEVYFNSKLGDYLIKCWEHLKGLTNVSDFNKNILSQNNENVMDILSTEQLDEMRKILINVTVNPKNKIAGNFLVGHTDKIISTLLISLEIGIPPVVEHLRLLSNPQNKIDGLNCASELGLPSEDIKKICEKYSKISDDESLEGEGVFSTLFYLINKIKKYVDSCEENSPRLVLIIVKERETAAKLCEKMKISNIIINYNLSVVVIMGHGAGSGIGMKVSNQKKVLEEIKEGKHQVVIATSVAEEGLDLPTCSLVITLKPPTSILTLVQMRGRARKKNSRFLTVCSSEKEKEKINSLLKQEEIMENATKYLVDSYKNEENNF